MSRHSNQLPCVRAGVAALVLVVSAGLVSACGTTVQLQGGSEAGDGLGLASPGGSSLTGSTTEPGLSGPVQQSGVSGQPILGSPGSGTATGTATTSSTLPPPSVPSGAGVGGNQAFARGVTAKTITVGVLYPEGFDQASSALGFGGATTGDVKAEAQAIIDSINHAGGVAGRRLVPVWVQNKSLSNTDQEPAQCAQLTQDNKVFAVMSVLQMTAEYVACFRKANLPLLDDAAGLTQAQLGSLQLISPGEPLAERTNRGLIAAMVKRGFFKPANKIGLLWLGTPEGNDLVNKVVEPALKSAGLNVVSKFAAPNDSSQISAYSSASLQFRTAGVDRVLSANISPLFFMEDASSQHYHPGYALQSDYGAGALLQLAAPKDQLANSVGMGWQPFSDVDTAHNPGPVSANETRCFKIMQAAGLASDSELTKLLQVQLCDSFFVFQQALQSTPDVTLPTLVDGVLALRAHYPSSATFTTTFGNRLDGPAATRDFSFFTKCSCFQYDRPLQQLA